MKRSFLIRLAAVIVMILVLVPFSCVFAEEEKEDKSDAIAGVMPVAPDLVNPPDGGGIYAEGEYGIDKSVANGEASDLSEIVGEELPEGFGAGMRVFGIMVAIAVIVAVAAGCCILHYILAKKNINEEEGR